MTIAKAKFKRVMITMDERLVIACDKFIEKLQENNVSIIKTKSQLVEKALLRYFNELEETLMEEVKKEHEN